MNHTRTLSMPCWLGILCASVITLVAQPVDNLKEASLTTQAVDTLAKEKPKVIERGPHHRVWERTITDKLPSGKTVERKSSFTELSTGMHYQNELGQWVESSEEIEIVNGAAVARQGQVQAVWAANLNSEGAVDVLTPDGKRFRSRILGLAYTDAISGQSVLIAEPKDCIGEVVGNQVFYRDAFDGPFRADVRYTYSRGGVSQDILIRESLPSAQEYNLSEERSRIEVWTEFTTAAAPVKSVGLLKTEPDLLVRQFMVDPDMTDETLDFGAVRIGPGSAFPLEPTSDDPFERSSAPVGKHWIELEGRTFLIEKIDLRDIREQVDRLPKSASVNAAGKAQMQAAIRSAAPRRQLLASLRSSVRKEARLENRTMRLAAAAPAEKGFVLDYSMVTSSTNFTFKVGTTYYISGNVTLSGSTVIEGDVVIKYTNTIIAVQGTLDVDPTHIGPAFSFQRMTMRMENPFRVPLEIRFPTTLAPAVWTSAAIPMSSTCTICVSAAAFTRSIWMLTVT